MRFRFIPLEERIVLDAAALISIANAFSVDQAPVDNTIDADSIHSLNGSVDSSEDSSAGNQSSENNITDNSSQVTPSQELVDFLELSPGVQSIYQDGEDPLIQIHNQNSEGSAINLLSDFNQMDRLLVLASNVKDANLLAEAALSPVVIYDPNTTALNALLEKISDALEGKQAASIAFVSYGAKGTFNLTDGKLISLDNLQSDPALQAFWHDLGNLIQNDGRIDILACGVASTSDGEQLVNDLQALASHDEHNVSIAASTNNTGHHSDWILETAGIDAGVLYFNQTLLAHWSGELDLLTANDDSYSTLANGNNIVSISGSILDNDFYIPGHDIIIFSTDPQHTGLGPGGAKSVFNTITGTFHYYMDVGFAGTDFFDYRIEDLTTGTVSNTARVTLNVNLQATDDSYSTLANGNNIVSISGSILDNDFYIPGNDFIIFSTDPQHTGLGPNGAKSVFNTVTGTFTYYMDVGFAGTDFFEYRIQDFTTGVASNTVRVNLTVNLQATEDTYSTHLNGNNIVSISGSILDNDFYIPGHDIIIFSTDPQHTGLGPNGAKSVFNTTTGTFTYHMDAGFVGTDFFEYRIEDFTSGTESNTVRVNLVVLNDAPIAQNDNYSIDEDTTLTVAASGVLSNDTDDGQALTTILVAGPTHGTLTLNSNGSFTYTPHGNYKGPDSFTYKANDGFEDSNNASVSITVNTVNDAPVLTGGATGINILEDINLYSRDFFAEDVESSSGDLTYTVFDVVGGSASVIPNVDGDIQRTVDFKPTLNYNGPFQFKIKANDGNLDSNIIIFSGTVTPVNDAPVLTGGATGINILEDVNIYARDFFAEDLETSSGDLIYTVFDVVGGTAHVVPNVDGDIQRTVDFKPTLNYNGPYQFKIKASDGNLDSNTIIFSGNVTPVNDAPVLTGGATGINILEDIIYSRDFFAEDLETSSGDLTYTVFDVVGGTAQVVPNVDGDVRRTVDFTPTLNYNGTYQFKIRASDGNLNSNTITFSGNVTVVNDAPIAINDNNYSTNEDTPLTIASSGVLNNDTDIDGNALNAVLVNGPTHGTLALNSDGSFSYTPNANYNGSDSFTYKANDGQANSNIATVSLTINPVNDAPVAISDNNYMTNEDTSLTIAAPGVLSNDTDIEGNALSAVLVTSPAHGSLTLNSNGTFTYTPHANYNGADSFIYKANDGQANSNNATVTITVKAINDAPVAVDDSYTLNHSVSSAVHLAGNVISDPNNSNADDFDIDSNTLVATLLAGPSHGSLILNPDGSFSYTAVNGYSGPDSFTYRLSDGQLTDDANVSIQVNNNPILQLSNAERIYREGARHPTIVTPSVTLIDTDNSSFNGAKMIFQVTNGTAADRLTIVENHRIDTNSQLIYYHHVLIGTYAGGEGSNALIIEFNANATSKIIKDVIKHVAFYNVSEAPSIADRHVSLVFRDQNGGESQAQFKNIHVYSVNDAPKISVDDGKITLLQNNWVNISNLLGISISDVDAYVNSLLSVTLSVNRGTLNITDANALNGITFMTNPGVNGLKEITFKGTLTEINEALNHIKYKSNLNFTGHDKLKIVVEDGGTDYQGVQPNALQTQLGRAKIDKEIASLYVTGSGSNYDKCH